MKKKLKIAIILPSFDIGGTENMVASLVECIDKKKFEILVISLFYPKNTYIQECIENTKVEVFYAMKGVLPSWRLFLNIYKKLKGFTPDLIHSNMYAYAFVVPYLLSHKVTLLHTVHNKPINEFKEKYKKLISFLYKSNKAVPVAISHIVEEEMKELYPCLKRIERVYNPVDTEKFRTDRKMNGKKVVSFINVARFMKQKNHNLLLEAFANASKVISEISLVLVGDGELRKQMEAKCKDLQICEKVIFTGNVKNVSEYLAASDVFILSSDFEGLPLSVLEAMASGLPIISTNVGGLADIVTDNGILTEPGDREGLTKAIIELSQNEEKRFLMGRYSALNAKKYDRKEFIRQYEALYLKYGKA